ncbi:hypothetical protein TrLO_g8762 [Triparma laevis f. longispina]|uniref:RING-type domain-containing protein n=1 Tax=Triparma laevis f. longispina TaxID=1714387 RepID=A0A9W7CBZ8_9STRA|nr:hypothetical protein TrLO_g8762 [Triparma laevis f. longispina]
MSEELSSDERENGSVDSGSSADYYEELRPCGHLTTCKKCTEELMHRKEPCPLCRKSFARFDIGKWQSSIGEHGLWPASLNNLTQLASGEGFNEYFQNMFNGDEASYSRWKEVFGMFEIVGGEKGVSLEQQVLMITKRRGALSRSS